ncbi:E3 ubiquitin-protein ligase BRE1-like 1 isoform X2 [Phalaenopsis equestris]|nr:E3 ubiquitin-protein ligase BRE1-like 1 isoform X2 [Phalaenopsis equestris]
MNLNRHQTNETRIEMLQYIINTINWTWFRSDEFLSSLRPAFSEDGMQLQNSIDDLRIEFRSLMVAVDDLHLKHILLASSIQNHRDRTVQFKAEQKHLEDIKSELEESNSKLASIKAQNVEMVRKEQKEIQDMEASLKELNDLVASRIVEISNLHGRRMEISKKLVNLKNVLLDFKRISSSGAFLMLKDQVDKSKMELEKYQILLKKLQVEKDNFLVHEKDANLVAVRAEINEKILEILKPLIDELEQELPKQYPDWYRLSMATKIEEKSREPSRRVVIQEFKNFVSSRHKEMRDMQNELVKLKDSSSEIHSLRSQVHSLSALLQREAYKLQSLYNKSAGQHFEIKNLHLVVEDLRKTKLELKLFLEMHQLESTESWDVMESRDIERKAWAEVQSLKSSLDEHNLKSQVRTVLEPEALTQQRLVTAKAEIADIRRNLEMSERQKAESSEKLNSKHDDCESYLSEIESIRGSFEGQQIENQQLFQEIMDRDEQNIELGKENLKAGQQYFDLGMEIKSWSRKVKVAESMTNVFYRLTLRLEEELKVFSNQVDKQADERQQSSVALDNLQTRLSDACTESLELRHSLNEIQMQAKKSGLELEVTELLIELGRERFNKKRIHEGLKALRIEFTLRKTQADEGSVVLEKLQKEISECRSILRCRVCDERQNDVVIAKCYHLFCRQCIQRIIGSRRGRGSRRGSRRHPKCPTCSKSFLPDNVKPIYL